MKTQFNTKWAINTIQMSLFITTHEPTLKGSIMWRRANQILNWLEQFDNDTDLIAISNNKIEFKVKED